MEICGYWPGDFNVVKNMREKWGREKLNNYELEFSDCANKVEVIDLAFSGCFFTWNNKREGEEFVARKLDKVMSNEVWLERYGKTEVEFLEGGISHHSPAVISVGKLQGFGPKPFKFFGFLDWVAEGWNLRMERVPLFKLYAIVTYQKKNVVCHC